MFVLHSPETDCQTIDWPMYVFFGVIAKDE